MERMEILNELKKFKVVPGSDSNVKNLTDKQLKLRLDLFRHMSEAADRALEE